MQILNKKGPEDSLCKTSHSKCFKTTNFDRFKQIPSRNKSFKFSNSDYAIDNVLVSYFVSIWFLHARTSTLICENTLLLSCLDQEENVYQMRGSGKGFAGRQRYVDILLSNMLNAHSTQFNTSCYPELNV